MIEYRFANSEDMDEIIDFINMIFSMLEVPHDFARMLPKDPEKIRPLLNHDVADPWYTGNFTETWNDVVEGCKKIMEEFA